jgi:hypothetical protein
MVRARPARGCAACRLGAASAPLGLFGEDLGRAAIFIEMDAAGPHGQPILTVPAAAVWPCITLIEAVTAPRARAIAAPLDGRWPTGEAGVAIPGRTDRAVIAGRRRVGHLAFEIRPGLLGKLLAQLVAQQARLDHLDAALWQIAELEGTVGNAD